jgi:hypothetical protein
MTDPRAGARKKQDLVETVTTRLPDGIRQNLDSQAFAEVRRGPAESVAAAVVLRAKITQYKPGSTTARLMMAGAGSAHLDLLVQLLDAATGQQLVMFPLDRTWGFGGVLGASKDIPEMERNLARELVIYLQQCKSELDPTRGTGVYTPQTGYVR